MDYIIRITPKGSKLEHTVLNSFGELVPCVAAPHDNLADVRVLSFNRKPAEVEPFLRWKFRRVATATAALGPEEPTALTLNGETFTSHGRWVPATF